MIANPRTTPIAVALSCGTWTDGWYQRDFTRHRHELARIRRIQRESLGKLNVGCLLQTPLVGNGLLLHETGRDIMASDFPGLPCSTKTVGSMIEMRWVGPHVLRFRLKGTEYPYPAADSFRRLCDTLVMCYPDLLAPHDPPHCLVERGQSTDVWYLQHDDDGPRLIREEGPKARADLGPVRSIEHAQALARRATGRRRVHFAPHPSLCVTLPLWGSTELYSKRRLRSIVARTAVAKASSELDARASAAERRDRDVAAALDRVSWETIHSLPHSSSRQRLAFLQIKGLRLSGWERANARRGCPHCPSAGPTGGDTFHIVWECPAAQRLWRALRSWWSSVGLWPNDDRSSQREFLTAVFSLRLPRTPPQVWELASLPQCPRLDDAPEGPFPALLLVWQQLVLETFVVIFGWRRSRFTPATAWSPTQATVIHDVGCHRLLGVLALRCARDLTAPPLHAALVRELQARFAGPVTPKPQPELGPPSQVVHVLFFDGGSRGNPGPGGAGACVVRVDIPGADYRVIWSAAMSHAHPATTNNQAEYRGLFAGLRAARRYRWPALEVIGDSALIIRQLRDHQAPKNTRLLRLYGQARRLADQVAVRHWFHHVRAHNAMADSLANLAMDTASSSQVLHPTARSGHAEVSHHLMNDLRPWLAASLGRHMDSPFAC